MSGNELLLEVEVFPDYGQIEISDVVGRDIPQSYGQTAGVVLPITPWMSSRRRLIRRSRTIRTCGPGSTAVPDGGAAISIERTGPVRIQIFVNPSQKAEEVNILIRYDL
jgi:hypothetical protein